MCRLLGYLGSSLQLDHLLYDPDHSLIVQSYSPQEMETAILNADGFGIGWYHPDKKTDPYTYRNTLPIWNDLNLPGLSRYVESGCVIGYVRSATPGLAVDLSNCQPFVNNNLLFTHNGYIENFRQTLYRPLRNTLNDYTYNLIKGTTDSEHIFAAIINQMQISPLISLQEAISKTLIGLGEMAKLDNIKFYGNVLLSDGEQLIATRYANTDTPPSLYWLKDHPHYPKGIIIASEPLFAANWIEVPSQSLLQVGKDRESHIYSLS